MKKSLIILVAFLGFSLGATAQSQKQKDKAMEKVKELNTQLTSIDKTLALDEEQMEKIMMLEVEKTKEMRSINKGEGTDEEKKSEKKAKRKEYQASLKEVLHKKQFKALRAAKKKNKE